MASKSSNHDELKDSGSRSDSKHKKTSRRSSKKLEELTDKLKKTKKHISDKKKLKTIVQHSKDQELSSSSVPVIPIEKEVKVRKRRHTTSEKPTSGEKREKLKISKGTFKKSITEPNNNKNVQAEIVTTPRNILVESRNKKTPQRSLLSPTTEHSNEDNVSDQDSKIEKSKELSKSNNPSIPIKEKKDKDKDKLKTYTLPSITSSESEEINGKSTNPSEDTSSTDEEYKAMLAREESRERKNQLKNSSSVGLSEDDSGSDVFEESNDEPKKRKLKRKHALTSSNNQVLDTLKRDFRSGNPFLDDSSENLTESFKSKIPNSGPPPPNYIPFQPEGNHLNKLSRKTRLLNEKFIGESPSIIFRSMVNTQLKSKTEIIISQCSISGMFSKEKQLEEDTGPPPPSYIPPPPSELDEEGYPKKRSNSKGKGQSSDKYESSQSLSSVSSSEKNPLTRGSAENRVLKYLNSATKSKTLRENGRAITPDPRRLSLDLKKARDLTGPPPPNYIPTNPFEYDKAAPNYVPEPPKFLPETPKKNSLESEGKRSKKEQLSASRSEKSKRFSSSERSSNFSSLGISSAESEMSASYLTLDNTVNHESGPPPPEYLPIFDELELPNRHIVTAKKKRVKVKKITETTPESPPPPDYVPENPRSKSDINKRSLGLLDKAFSKKNVKTNDLNGPPPPSYIPTAPVKHNARVNSIMLLLSTTRSLTEDIEVIYELYQPLAENHFLSDSELRSVFFNIDELYNNTAKYLFEPFMNRVKMGNLSNIKIGLIFLNLSHLWQAFRTYSIERESLSAIIEKLEAQRIEFKQFTKEYIYSRECRSRPKNLRELLDLPVIMLVQLLNDLNNVIKCTDHSHEDYQNLVNARYELCLILFPKKTKAPNIHDNQLTNGAYLAYTVEIPTEKEKILDIYSFKRHVKKVLKTQQNIEVKIGNSTISHSDILVFLFTDLLLLASKKKKEKLELWEYMKLNNNVEVIDKGPNSIELIQVSNIEKSIIIGFDNPNLQKEWFDELQAQTDNFIVHQ